MGLDVQNDLGDAKTRIETERMLPNVLLEKGVKQTRNYPAHKSLIKCCDK